MSSERAFRMIFIIVPTGVMLANWELTSTQPLRIIAFVLVARWLLDILDTKERAV